MKKKILLMPLVVAAAMTLLRCSVSLTGPDAGNSLKNPHRLGAVPDSPALLEKKLVTKSEMYSVLFPQTRAELPAAVDQTASIPPVGDQGSQNSCVAWATAYYTKTFQEKMEEKWDITLSCHQFSPSWVYNQLDGGGDNGISPAAAFDLLIENGCDTLDHFPYNQYDCTTQPDSASFQRAQGFYAAAWFTLPEDINMIKQYLAQNKVVIGVISIKPDFDAISPSNKIYDDFTGDTRGFHAVCIIGYDDSIQALKFVNSWGSEWGTWKDDADTSKGKGYGWLSYSLINPVHPELFSSYILVDTNNYQVKAPGFSPSGGAYTTPQTVTIACDTTGASIRFTTNGQNPSPNYGILYNGPITVSSSVTIKTIATKAGFTDSGIASAGYSILSPVKILFYNEDRSVNMNALYLDFIVSNTSGAVIDLSKLKLRYYYTKDFAAGQSFYCDYSGSYCTPLNTFYRLESNVTAACIAMPNPVSLADTYAEIGFSSGTGTLYTGDAVEVKGRILNSLWGFYTQTNDYSFNPTAACNTDWNNVTGYLDGTPVWGIEPK